MTDEKPKRKPGRPKGSPNKGTELGRKTIFRSSSVSGSPEEIAQLHEMAKVAGKSFSRFVIDSLLCTKK